MSDLSKHQKRRRKRKELVQQYTIDYLTDRKQWTSVYDILRYIEWDAKHKKRLSVPSLTALIAPLVWNGTLKREIRFVGHGREPCYIMSQYADSTEEEE